MTYHLVDLRGNGYRGGYRDTDVRILFACFKLFEEFYEAKRKWIDAWKKAEAQDQQMLLRLMAIRERLWT